MNISIKMNMNETHAKYTSGWIIDDKQPLMNDDE